MKTILLLLFTAISLLSVPLYAQNKAGKKDTTSHTTFYTCPMHPAVMENKPGVCPKCGMQLQLSKKEAMKKDTMKDYTCPMHAQITSDKPGKCSVCGMNLVVTEKEKKHSEIVNGFTCPMHADVMSDSAGTCPKCGMKLVKKS